MIAGRRRRQEFINAVRVSREWMVNPYLTPASQTVATRRGAYKSGLLAVFLYFYPLLPVGGVYMAWGVSALALGRIPVAFRDYPENPAVLICAYTGAVTLLMAPFVLPFGFYIAFWRPFGFVSTSEASLTTRLTSLGAFCAVIAIVCLLFRYDPGGVLTWFFD